MTAASLMRFPSGAPGTDSACISWMPAPKRSEHPHARCAPEGDQREFGPEAHEIIPGDRPLAHARWVAQELSNGRCPPDSAFDRYLPEELRRVSRQYWTPLAVTLRAAAWLEEAGVRTVVDIGAGAGKFCVAGALASSCDFIGLEHRPRLVGAARILARAFGVAERVTFLEGAFGEVEVPAADAYYLYNPFGENLSPAAEHLDEDVELGGDRFQREVAAFRAFLRTRPAGVYVATFNGFGGLLPDDYVPLRIDRTLPDLLQLWRK